VSSDWRSAYLRDRGIRSTIPQKPSVHRTTFLDAQPQRRGCPRTRGRFDATHDPKVPLEGTTRSRPQAAGLTEGWARISGSPSSLRVPTHADDGARGSRRIGVR
jgi:hypothetical protein